MWKLSGSCEFLKWEHLPSRQKIQPPYCDYIAVDYCHKLVEQMEKNLCNLSEHLREAYSLMSTFLDRGQLCCPNSSNGGNQSVINSTSASSAQPEHGIRFSEVQSKAQPRSSGTGLSAASIGNRIGSAVAHARSMITSLAFTGVYSRLSQRERLRASTSAAWLR